jgi:site-specific DNA-methyltransferase (adenine-specific)
MIELLNTDCVEYMKKMPYKHFDLAIVDPPFGLNISKNGSIGNPIDNPTRGFKKSKNYGSSDWDKAIPTNEYWSELFRISKNQIIWGYNFYSNILPPTSSPVVWYKKGGYENNYRFSPFELAWTSFKKMPKYYKIDWLGFNQINSGEKKIHPCQKPINLYKMLLSDFAKTGDKILDTHLGSASSAIVADMMGFDFVGLEIDKQYFDNAVVRFNKETDLPLFKNAI